MENLSIAEINDYMHDALQDKEPGHYRMLEEEVERRENGGEYKYKGCTIKKDSVAFGIPYSYWQDDFDAVNDFHGFAVSLEGAEEEIDIWEALDAANKCPEGKQP